MKMTLRDVKKILIHPAIRKYRGILMDLNDCLKEMHSFLMSTLKGRYCFYYDENKEFLQGFETDENLPNQVMSAAYGHSDYYAFAEDYGEVIDAICKYYGKDIRIAALRELCEWVIKTAASEILKNLVIIFQTGGQNDNSRRYSQRLQRNRGSTRETEQH